MREAAGLGNIGVLEATGCSEEGSWTGFGKLKSLCEGKSRKKKKKNQGQGEGSVTQGADCQRLTAYV